MTISKWAESFKVDNTLKGSVGNGEESLTLFSKAEPDQTDSVSDPDDADHPVDLLRHLEQDCRTDHREEDHGIHG
ncbi:hypothetical protein PCCS19_39880 [Paenibacillus sp. CCS19]|nr:hypothetical protein PCCS19_39880 [Paenibacillus cellulosilyticus]